MKKSYLSAFIIIIIYSISSLFAQAPDTLWTRMLSGNVGKSVFATSDGGFVVGGYKSVNGYRDFYIAKVDALGDLVWEYTYGFEGISETMNCMIRTSDGGFMMAGNTMEDPPNSSYTDNLLVKTNEDGQQEWYSIVGANDESDSPACIAETLEGGFVMTGSIWWDGYNGYDITLTKVNPLGAFEWKEHYNFEQGKAEYGLWVEVNADGDFIITGETQAYTTNYDYDAFIMKTTPLGTLLSFTNYGENWPMYEGAYRLLQTTDGHYLICGYQNNDNLDNNWYVVKTGENGWTHTIGGTYHDKAYNACETADGGYAVTGTYHEGMWNSFIVRYTSDGDTLWTKLWGDGEHNRYNYDIKELDDGGFITVGSISTGTYTTGLYITRLVPVSPSSVSSGNDFPFESVQLQPNPYDEKTTLTFTLNRPILVRIKIFDITGSLNSIIYESEMSAGRQQINIHEDISPGVYFCEIGAGDLRITKKLIRTK